MARVVEAVSIVIPTLGRPILRHCLEAIAAGSVWPARLIVVDQSESDRARDWVADLEARGLACERPSFPARGRAYAVNRGLEHVRTPFVAITDDDCLVEPTWLAAISARLTHDPGSIVTGPVDPAGPEPVVSIRRSRKSAVQRRPSLFGGELLSGGNMGVAVSVAARIGPLDEDPSVAIAEDRDWAYRALRAGVPIVYAPEIVVHHYGWRDVRERIAQYEAYGRSHGAFYGRHARGGDGLLALRYFLHLGYAAAKTTFGWLLARPEQRHAGAAFFRGMIPGLLAGLRRDRPLGPVPIPQEPSGRHDAAAKSGTPPN